MRRELLTQILLFPIFPGLASFSKDIKQQVNEEQNYTCARCGTRVRWMGPHHVVPEKALQGRGVRGKNIQENAVGLCSGENGRGMNSDDDCHEIADQMAIKENKFWHNGRFVDLSELDPNTYVGCYHRMPENRNRYHKTKKRRHRRHR